MGSFLATSATASDWQEQVAPWTGWNRWGSEIVRRVAVILVMFANSGFCATNPTDVLNEAFQQMKSGNCAGLPETLRPLLSEESQFRESAYRLLSDCYLKTRQLQMAADTLREGLIKVPESGVLERSLGEVLFHQIPSNAEAGELLNKSVESLPRDPEARHFYAQWAYLNNRQAVCVEQEKEALTMTGSNELALLQIHSLKALCEEAVGKVKPAEVDFRDANSLNLKLARFDPATAYQYAEFLTRHDRAVEAQAIVGEMLTRTPQFGPAHLERAKYFDHQGQRKQAIEEAERALAGEGNDPDGTRATHVLLAKLYFAVGRTEEAGEQQQWVIAHSGKQ